MRWHHRGTHCAEHELLLEERNEAYTKSKSIAKLEQELNILLHIRKE